MTAFPPRARYNIAAGLPSGVLTSGGDPAVLLVDRSRYRRPSISSGSLKFEWPGGTEGVRIVGSATLAEHKYFDDNKIVVQVTHRDERRITLSGQFSGNTAAVNFRSLLDVITAFQPANGKILSVPGVFMRAQKVAVMDYDFDHPDDDRTHSFNYTITFRFLGVGSKIANVKTITPQTGLNPKTTTSASERGTTARVFRVHSGARTLRAIAQLVYGNPNKWKDLYTKNGKILNGLNIPTHKLPTTVLPLGLLVKY